MSDVAGKAASGDSQDEIDQILNEVEELRKELDATGAPPTVAPTPAPVVASQEPRLEDILEGNQDPLSKKADAQASEMAEAADELMKEFHSSIENAGEHGGDGGMEETLASVKPDTSVKTILDEDDYQETEYAESNVIALHDKVVAQNVPSPISAQPSAIAGTPAAAQAASYGAEPGCLKMTLSGNMTLKLQYEFAGQEVTISFIDDCLKVETYGGAEFKIPFGGGNPSGKKSKQAG